MFTVQKLETLSSIHMGPPLAFAGLCQLGLLVVHRSMGVNQGRVGY